MQQLLPTLLMRFSLQEWRHHPWRHAAALLAVMLGVALAYSVHLINNSALDEFSSAARAVSGQADLELRPAPGPNPRLDEAWLAQLTAHPDVAIASPLLDISTFATGSTDKRVPLRVLGVDVLQIARIAPQLLPMPHDGSDRFAWFAPSQVFLNPSAQAVFTGGTLQLQHGLQSRAVRVAGTVSTSGAPLAVMDIAAAQDLFGRGGQLSRIDLRLKSGVDINAFMQQMQTTLHAPGAPRLERPDDAQARLSALSLAYRVNLTVLALVALFTGGFLVYSVVSLGVARRTPQFALLGVLGLTGTQGMALVLMESALLGLVGSIAGLALGTALAATALQLLGGDLGGGYFSGAAPALQLHVWEALLYGSSGVLMAAIGAWAPARQVQQLPLAPTLKGLGSAHARALHGAWGAGLLVLGVVLALLPAIGGVPVAAYVSVGALLLGGILSLPWLIALTLDRVAPLVQRRALPLLALERARRVRESAAVAVSGVVAALSLAVALTVMVASFRHSVIEWLDGVLPADLYVRTSRGGAANDTAFLEPQLVSAAQRIPGVQRVVAQRSMAVPLSPTAPSASLVVRPLRHTGNDNGDPSLPLVGEGLPIPADRIGIYISEAVRDLYGVQAGGDFPALSAWFSAAAPEIRAQAAPFFIAGVFRDYARQFGTIAIDTADFSRLVQDTRVNDLALWLEAGTDTQSIQGALRALAPNPEMLEFGSAQEIRTTSLKIFDRSFAVTYWLQAVAIAIGLFGVAASFSAQVLARRKEFGLLAHLGFTRRQVLQVVALEGLAWTTLGALAGLLLGLAVAVVLVHVVNPQSFHWTMELTLPWLRLLALAAVVVASGTLTAWLTGRAAASSDAVMAVKEDW
ncbi:MAG: ABC transporter permease [Rhodoferax sp.]|nr:ABC transporter permease [Rhodoferax sp.]